MILSSRGIVNSTPDKQSLWDWKANVHEAYVLLTDTDPQNFNSKYRWIKNKMSNDEIFPFEVIAEWNDLNPDNIVEINQTYGGIIWKAAMTPLFQNTEIPFIRKAFKETLETGERSVLDACLIDLYNSGLPSELFLSVAIPPIDCEGLDCKPEWILTDNSRNYVKLVAEQAIPQN